MTVAITFVSSTTVVTNPNSPVGDAWTFAIPAGSAAGDVLLFCIGSAASVSSACHITTPGWVTPLFFRGDDSDLAIAVAYQLTGAEVSPITVTFSEDLGISFAIPVALLYRGAALPKAASSASTLVSNGAGQFQFVCPSRTPTVIGQRYVGIAHANSNPVVFDSTPATQRFVATGGNGALAVFDLAAVALAPFGAQAVIAHTASQAGSAHAFVLPLAPPPVLAALGAGAGDLALILPTSFGTVLDGMADLRTVSAGLTSGAVVDLASDEGLLTAILLSLFTDRRADVDDVPPSGIANDRRGWWADQFAAVEGDLYGSRLWLLDRSKRTGEVAQLAAEYVREALAWMLEDLVGASIDVVIEVSLVTLVIGVTVQRPARDPVPFRFERVWDNTQGAS